MVKGRTNGYGAGMEKIAHVSRIGSGIVRQRAAVVSTTSRQSQRNDKTPQYEGFLFARRLQWTMQKN
jgi:hypothetical protein